jgi:bifunctional DNA-binding transcriptional regulator/antitoxin component of YhaV-PrlF toxin-antitoxin module
MRFTLEEKSLMIEMKIKVTEGGKIALPIEYRQALGVDIGDEVILRLEDGEVRVFTPRLAVKRAQQRLERGYTSHRPSLADELIAGSEKKSKK